MTWNTFHPIRSVAQQSLHHQFRTSSVRRIISKASLLLSCPQWKLRYCNLSASAPMFSSPPKAKNQQNSNQDEHEKWLWRNEEKRVSVSGYVAAVARLTMAHTFHEVLEPCQVKFTHQISPVSWTSLSSKPPCLRVRDLDALLSAHNRAVQQHPREYALFSQFSKRKGSNPNPNLYFDGLKHLANLQ